MAFTKIQTTHLNSMNKAAQAVGLGTILNKHQGVYVTAGSYVAVAADASASKVTLPTGLGTISGYQTEIYRSGSTVVTAQYIQSTASGSIVMSSGSQVVTGDLYTFIAW